MLFLHFISTLYVLISILNSIFFFFLATPTAYGSSPKIKSEPKLRPMPHTAAAISDSNPLGLAGKWTWDAAETMLDLYLMCHSGNSPLVSFLFSSLLSFLSLFSFFLKQCLKTILVRFPSYTRMKLSLCMNLHVVLLA